MTHQTNFHPDYQSFIERQLREWKEKYGPSSLYEPIYYILNQKGKKIRFQLTMKACQVFSKDTEAALYAALAIEVFHNFTLIHDDVMDGAETRRNAPTVHTKWDLNTAILSGDAMMILAYQVLLQNKKAATPDILRHFTDTAREVCEGQQLDMDFENLPAVQMDSYLEMIARKTAVLIGTASRIGALCGGAGKKEAEALYHFGKNLGMAFQIRDDYLDCYGNSRKTGKQRGGDILQAKKTILYIRTWLALAPEEQPAFEKLYHNDSADKVNRVLEYFDRADAEEYTLQREQEYFSEALKALDESGLPPEKQALLTDFAGQLTGREK